VTKPSPSTSRWQAWLVGIVFMVYAVALFVGARWIGHHFLHGWWARLATMGMIALGLMPWGSWLQPRLVRVLGLIGRGVLVLSYFTVLVPFAIISRMSGDLLRRRRPAGPSQWLPRPPLPNTLDAARLES